MLGIHLQAQSLPPMRADVGERVGIEGVLDDPDRVGRAVEVPGRAAKSGFTWDDADAGDPDWYPQGITTAADATGSDLDGRDVILVSWYAVDRSRGPGTRITCIDHTDPDRPPYRHVLLVEPVAAGPGAPGMRPVQVHAGGIVWYGPYLYVAGTREGVRVFCLDDVVRVDDPALSHGYRYVLPQHSTYRAQSPVGADGLRYSFLSLDRTGPTHHLVAGEYGEGRRGSHRLTRYELDRATYLLSGDEEGRAVPLELLEHRVARMQGAALVDGTWLVTTSQGRGRPGDLWAGGPGSLRRHRRVLPTGPEDVAYWPARREFWSVTEWPGSRWVFAIDDAWLHRPALPSWLSGLRWVPWVGS